MAGSVLLCRLTAPSSGPASALSASGKKFAHEFLKQHFEGLGPDDLEIASEVAEAIVKRTDGVSAAFIKELMRRSAQFCLDSGTAPTLALADVDGALDELLGDGSGLTATLLGRPTS